MKARNIIQKGFERGRDAIESRANQKALAEAEYAELIAKYNRESKERSEASLRQHQEDVLKKRPDVELLAKFTGKLVVMTNPQSRLGYGSDTLQRRARLNDSLQNVFSSGASVGYSTHAPQDRVEENIAYDLDEVWDAIALPMALKNIELQDHTRDNVIPYTPEGNLRDSLTEALSVSNDTLQAQGHLAVVSAFGMPDLDLDYYRTRHGNAYLLTGVTDHHEFEWQQIFDMHQK